MLSPFYYVALAFRMQWEKESALKFLMRRLLSVRNDVMGSLRKKSMILTLKMHFSLH